MIDIADIEPGFLLEIRTKLKAEGMFCRDRQTVDIDHQIHMNEKMWNFIKGFKFSVSENSRNKRIVGRIYDASVLLSKGLPDSVFYYRLVRGYDLSVYDTIEEYEAAEVMEA